MTLVHYQLTGFPWNLDSVQVGDTFEGFEIDNAAATAAAFAAAASSTLLKNGPGKFSLSAKSYSGER